MTNHYQSALALEVAEEFANLGIKLNHSLEEVQSLSAEIEAITPDIITPVEVENLKTLALLAMKMLTMSMLVDPTVDAIVSQMPLPGTGEKTE